MNYTAIPRLIEIHYSVPRLKQRDAHAGDMSDFADFWRSERAYGSHIADIADEATCD
jgi:hypothetical protein